MTTLLEEFHLTNNVLPFLRGAKEEEEKEEEKEEEEEEEDEEKGRNFQFRR